MNQLFFDMTDNLRDWQTFGTYPHITAAMNGGADFLYAFNARVLGVDGKIYESKSGGNFTTPPGAFWAEASNVQRMADLSTLSGVPENSINLGTFTGTVISDNTTIKNALQQLETRLQNIQTADLTNLSVTTAKIADLAVTNAKIGPLAVTGDKIAGNSIDETRLQADCVGTSELQPNAVENINMASNSVSTAELTSDAVVTSKILNGAVATAKIADLAVTTAKIANLNVTEGKIGTNAVTTTKIADLNVTQSKLALASVGQAQLKTSTGNAAFACNVGSGGSNGENVIMPGGEYAFNNLTGQSVSAGNASFMAGFLAELTGVFAEDNYAGCHIVDLAGGGGATSTNTVTQRYVTASPPFNLGHGDIANFTFVKVDRKGNITAAYSADVPPWAYNGPTNIRPDRIEDIGGGSLKKYKNVPKNMPTPPWKGGDYNTWLAWEEGEKEFEEIEIDYTFKNSDMHLIPHPFRKPKSGDQIFLLDPTSSFCDKLEDMNQAGESVSSIVMLGYVDLGDEIVANKPSGTKIITPSWKNT